jgi:hypothetical protein
MLTMKVAGETAYRQLLLILMLGFAQAIIDQFGLAKRVPSRRNHREMMQASFCLVGDFVALKASNNHKVQQLSTSRLQQVQHQSLRSNKFQQSST